MHRKGKPTGSWASHQPHLAKEIAAGRPNTGQRFPSRDIWEDAPESLILETTVSTPQRDETSPEAAKQPEVPPQRPVRKPSDPSSENSDKPGVPERPRPKQAPPEESSAAKPTVPDRPKPQVPTRPAKLPVGTDKDAEASGPRSKLQSQLGLWVARSRLSRPASCRTSTSDCNSGPRRRRRKIPWPRT